MRLSRMALENVQECYGAILYYFRFDERKDLL